MGRPHITLFAENLGILPIDDVIVLHRMVSNCWLISKLDQFWRTTLPSVYETVKRKSIFGFEEWTLFIWKKLILI